MRHLFIFTSQQVGYRSGCLSKVEMWQNAMLK